jgi:hypothetical protein
MKTKPSHYVLLAEILIISLFHAAKIRQSEKSSTDIVYTPVIKTITLHKAVIENETDISNMLNLIK